MSVNTSTTSSPSSLPSTSKDTPTASQISPTPSPVGSTPSSSNDSPTPGLRVSSGADNQGSPVFNERNFHAKLTAVVPTQDSIQSLGLWIIHHKFNHEAICRIWIDKLNDPGISSKQKLALFYLANDVIQNCRRKNAKIFQDTFRTVLNRAVEIVGRIDSIVKNVERVLEVWLERGVYEREFVNKLIRKLQDEKSKILKSPPDDSTLPVDSKPKPAIHPKPIERTLSANHNPLENSSIEEIIAEFQVKKLCESLASFQSVLNETNQKKTQVESTRILDVSQDHIKQHRDKSNCSKFKAEFENSCLKLEEFVRKLESQAKQRVELVRLMQKSEIFYDAQFNDAKTVQNVYRIYGSKVHTMKKKLDEYILEKFDNKETSDMEMSDEEVKEANSHVKSSVGGSASRPTGSIRTNLDPRQNRNGTADSERKNKSSNSKSSSFGGKRKSDGDTTENDSAGKKPASDPFDFLSKLINKSANGSVPGASGKSEPNPNLSFLVNSLQKFVNSGSNSSGLDSNGSQGPQMDFGQSSGAGFYEDPYQVGPPGYMLMNAPPPPPGRFYPPQTTGSVTSSGALPPLTIPPTHYHPQFYPTHPPHQLMDIDIRQYPGFNPPDPNSPGVSVGLPSPNSTFKPASAQISPLMAIKPDEFHMPGLDNGMTHDFQARHRFKNQTPNPNSPGDIGERKNSFENQSYDPGYSAGYMNEYEYDPNSAGFSNGNNNQSSYRYENKKRFNNNRRLSYNQELGDPNFQPAWSQRAGGSRGPKNFAPKNAEFGNSSFNGSNRYSNRFN